MMEEAFCHSPLSIHTLDHPLPATYCFLDVETTGFDSLRNQVLTLACYVCDSSHAILGEYYGEFRPEGARDIVWSEGAEKVHGISWHQAQSFPCIRDASEAFLSFIEQYPSMSFIAHNVAYDRRMLRGTLSRHDLHFRMYEAFPEYIDTVKLLKESGLVSGKSFSLGTVCKQLGIDHSHHDARSDARVLIEIHKRCMGNDAPTDLLRVNGDKDGTDSRSESIGCEESA